MKRIQLVYFATPDFSTPVLDLLYQHPEVEIVEVVSMPDRPAGRGQKLKSPPVVEFARENKIPIVQTENINKEKEVHQRWKKQGVNIFLVLAFAQFLSKEVLSIPKDGAFNIHTSLLPKYRGAAPIQYALLNGDKETGICIQKMVTQMDAGDIALEQKISISPNETAGQLYTRLKYACCELVNLFLSQYLEKSLTLKTQDINDISYAPSIPKDMGRLQFDSISSREAFNKVRALTPWPGAYFYLSGKRVKLFACAMVNECVPVNELKIRDERIFIGTKEGTIELLELQQEGKKRTSAQNFLNGINSKNQLTLS